MLLGREDAGAHGYGSEGAAVARELFGSLRDLGVVLGLANDLTGAGGDLLPAGGGCLRKLVAGGSLATGERQRSQGDKRQDDAVHGCAPKG